MLRSDPRVSRGPCWRRLQTALRRAVLATGLVTALAMVAAGCADSDPPPPEPARPTPLAKLDTSAMVIPRIAFCDLVSDGAAADALGGEVAETDEWSAGDPVGSEGGRVDVASEFGCSWSAEDGSTARAWVFAVPVTQRLAEKALREGAEHKGCRTPSGPAFGSPSQVQVCTLDEGTTRIRHAGLFGDAWLSCELASSSEDTAVLRERADAWCGQVATALDTSD
jgi:hypothetical protein